jgi:polar amino acid transport system permease protein
LNRGQSEAGLALGLNRFEVLRLIELPQALAAMIPTFINEAIQLIKGTSLVSLITLSDMTFRAKQIAETSYNPVGVYSALLLSYLILCYPVTILGRHLERRYGTTQKRSGEGSGLGKQLRLKLGKTLALTGVKGDGENENSGQNRGSDATKRS